MENKENNVLIYARPWNAANLSFFFNKFPEFNLYFISEHSKVSKAFVSLWKETDLQSCENNIFDHNEVCEIIARCRLLRKISYKESEFLIRTFSEVANSYFEEKKINLVFSLIPDNYISDIIFKIAEKKGIQAIGIVPLFIKGYVRFTDYGLGKFSRNVSKSELAEIYESLKNWNNVPSFLKSTAINFNYKKLIKEYLVSFSRKIFFGLLYNKYNYHFYINKIESGLFNLPFYNYFKEDFVKETNKTYIFFPLQYYPEATIDYWSDDIGRIDYYKLIYIFFSSVIKANDLVFVVKEHPSMIYRRQRDFLNQLSSLENVKLIHSKYDSRFLINNCSLTLTWNGSVGIETILSGKKVFAIINSYYSGLSQNIYVLKNIEKFYDELRFALAQKFKYDKDEELMMIQKILEQSHRLSWGNSGNYFGSKRLYDNANFDIRDLIIH